MGGGDANEAADLRIVSDDGPDNATPADVSGGRAKDRTEDHATALAANDRRMRRTLEENRMMNEIERAEIAFAGILMTFAVVLCALCVWA